MTPEQTVGDQIRAMEPQEANGRVNPREAWEAARNQAAALADAATPTGWVIANGNNNRWRCVWEWESNVEWTDDITQALKFATRDDAERYSKEDEDAWLIYQVGIPPTTTPVVGAEQAGDVRQAVRVKPRDLSNLLKHAFIAGRVSGGCSSSFHSDAWVEYNPAESAAFARITAALEPDPTPALCWKAMQTAVAGATGWEAHVVDSAPLYLSDWQRGLVAGQQALRHAILAMTGPSDEQALAEAVNLPEVQEFAAIMKEVLRVSDRSTPLWNSAHAALVKIGKAK